MKEKETIDKDLIFEKDIKYQVEIKKEGTYSVRYETTPETSLFAISLIRDYFVDITEKYFKDIDESELTDKEKVDDPNLGLMSAIEAVIPFLDDNQSKAIQSVYGDYKNKDFADKYKIITDVKDISRQERRRIERGSK